MLWTFDARIFLSRLMTGTPICTAVAATVRSGISGISEREIRRIAPTIATVSGAATMT